MPSYYPLKTVIASIKILCSVPSHSTPAPNNNNNNIFTLVVCAKKKIRVQRTYRRSDREGENFDSPIRLAAVFIQN